MKLLDEYEMNEWAYDECNNGNDTPEIRKLITEDCLRVYYCHDIKDRKEMWSKITERWWANFYCEEVKDRPEVRKYIK